MSNHEFTDNQLLNFVVRAQGASEMMRVGYYLRRHGNATNYYINNAIEDMHKAAEYLGYEMVRRKQEAAE